jgi:hypothetical protein
MTKTIVREKQRVKSFFVFDQCLLIRIIRGFTDVTGNGSQCSDGTINDKKVVPIRIPSELYRS